MSEDAGFHRHGLPGFPSLSEEWGFRPSGCTGFRPCPKTRVFACTVRWRPPLPESSGFFRRGTRYSAFVRRRGFPSVRFALFSALVRRRWFPSTLVHELSPLSEDADFRSCRVAWPSAHARKAWVLFHASADASAFVRRHRFVRPLACHRDVAAEAAAPRGHPDRSPHDRADPMDSKSRPKPSPSSLSHPPCRSRSSVLGMNGPVL